MFSKIYVLVQFIIPCIRSLQVYICVEIRGDTVESAHFFVLRTVTDVR